MRRPMSKKRHKDERTLFGAPDQYGGMSAKADPPTSREAAKELVESGKLSKREEMVLALVRRFPGLTYRELWNKRNAVFHSELGTAIELMRRLGGLKGRKVRHGEIRECEVAERRMVTWWAL